MRHVDFTPFYRSTVGFDRLFDLLGSGSEAEANVYPPYNIERLSENEYRITMAVAGFSQDELKIDVKEQALNVRGEKTARGQGTRVPAPRHRRPHVRAALPACRPCRGQGRRPEGRPAQHRPGAQRARAAEAAHDRHRCRQGPASCRGAGREGRLTSSLRLQASSPAGEPVASRGVASAVARSTGSGRPQHGRRGNAAPVSFCGWRGSHPIDLCR